MIYDRIGLIYYAASSGNGGEYVSIAGTDFLEYFSIIFNVLVILFLVALNGFFVASEFSIVKVRPSRLDTLIKEGDQQAVHARKITEHLDAYLSVTQLGITLASLGLGWIGEPAVAKMLTPIFHLFELPAQLEHTVAFVVGFSLITALHIVLGELVPKSLSIQKTEKVVLFIAWPLIMFNKIMYPAVWLLNHVANWAARRMGIQAASEADEAHNEDEIRILMEESYKYGYIDKSELTYLDNVFDFSERHASEIMVPRTDMICMFLDDSFTENIQVALNERMTRYPICEDDKDHIIGFLHIKDLLRALNAGQKPDLRTLAREVLVVPESMPISKLLRLLQKQRKQLAVLIDEYGGTAGMVTIEDILEEIVGEIQDEFDEERPEIEDEGEKTYSIDGKMLLEDVNDLFGLELDSNTCDTIGGWVYSQLDYPPQLGQSVKLPTAEFVVEELDNIRIIRLKVKLLKDPGGIHQGMLEEHLHM